MEVQAEEEVSIPEPEPYVPVVESKADFSGATKQQAMPEISNDLFSPFRLGDVPQVQSAPDNKVPTQEDTMEGRYAAVLFTSASTENALFTVYEDVVYLQALYNNSETFRNFTQNAGVGSKEIGLFNEAL